MRVEGLSKRYRIGQTADRYGRLTESLWGAVRSPVKTIRSARQSESFYALKDVSMQVQEGEVVGIIGRNGAGKTTLLKILSRITAPTEGTARLNGRVASLLEVGTGFHPELTGRENIFLNGAILGMRRAETRQKLEEIVEFAGVEKFLDTPVKRYSSGMRVRLAFAVAAHLEPEILIVDEVLSVGDAEFQSKCLGKMAEVAGGGRTVLFVSHNLAAVEALCSKAVLLHDGEAVYRGTPHHTVERYLRKVKPNSGLQLLDQARQGGDGKLRFVDLDARLVCGKGGTISLSYKSPTTLRNVSVSLGIFTLRGEGVAYLSNDLTRDSFATVPRQGRFVCEFVRVPLLPGAYALNVYCTVNGVLADWITDVGPVEVAEGDFFGNGKLPPPGYGSVAVSHGWHLNDS